MAHKKSFFERLTGGIRLDDENTNEMEALSEPGKLMKLSVSDSGKHSHIKEAAREQAFMEQEAELTVDVYQTASEIVVQTMVAGVLPENLSINITRDMITLRGKREENRSIKEENYYIQELYWGAFSRVISLPEEVDPEEAEAIEKHGLLIIRLPKINKNKETTLRVKSI
ncbi:MAG: Hsp20/alpha crystallin family protein [bacterium]